MASPNRHALTLCLWISFLVWTALVALVWALGIGEAEVIAWTERQFHLAPRETGQPLAALPGALVALLQWIDPVWIVLAAANAYAFTAQREGLAVARQWSGMIVLTVAVVAWISAKTGWPLGPVHYTGALGPRIGPLPFCVPLLWLTVLLGARDLVLRRRPALGQLPLALGTGLLVLLFDFALEPLARKVHVFWLWIPSHYAAPMPASVQNYVTWFLLGALLTYNLREKQIVSVPQPVHRSPAAIYLALLAVVLLAYS